MALFFQTGISGFVLISLFFFYALVYRKELKMEDQRKIAVYIRVSSRDQAINGYGLDAQLEKCMSYLKIFDYPTELVQIFSDEGQSAKDLKRVAMKKMLKEVRENRIQSIVIYKLDRITRSVVDMAKIVSELNEHNCKLISIVDNLDINSANGRMLVNFLAVMVQWEREVISERTKDALTAMAQQGKYPYSKCPFGWRKDENKRLEIHPEHSKILLDLIARIINGYSLNELVFYVNDTYNMRVRYITLRNWVTRTALYGELICGGVKYDQIIPPIITKEKYEQLQNSIKKYNRDDEFKKYWFYGKVYCSCGRRCRQVSTKKRTKTYYYYYCEHCNLRINQESVQKQVFFDLIRFENKIQKPDIQNKLLQYAKIQDKINSIHNMYLKNYLTEEEYVSALAQTRKLKKEIINDLTSLHEMQKALLHFQVLNDIKKKSWVKNLVGRIVVNLKDKTVVQVEEKIR